MSPNFKEEDELVSICGYLAQQNGYFLAYHTNFLEYSANGGQYDIDAMEGQSGSPIYFIEEGPLKRCRIVGLHKGRDRGEGMNVGVLMTG